MTFEELYTVDKSNMYRLLKDFPGQIGEAVSIGKGLTIRKKLTGIRGIVLTGMGGSAIGGDLLADYLSDGLPIPFHVSRSYSLPAFVDRHTLVIVSSYSGNTEETNSAYREAMKRRAKILCITSGGKIGRMARAKRHLLITVPGGLPPRTALGYSFFPILLALTNLGLVKNKARDITETMQLLSRKSAEYGVPDPVNNRALQLAEALNRKNGYVYAGGEHFRGVATRWRGQIAENGKSLISTHVVPEMNHNEIVGWHLPPGECQAVFLRDRGDHKRVQVRLDLTKGLISEKTPHIAEVWSEGTGLLARIFSLVYLGDWTSYYLAILHGEDPTPVKAIDWLKHELEKS